VDLGGGSNVVMLGVWDGRNGAFVTNAIVTSDLDATLTSVDRVNLAADALDRVCVAFDGKPDTTGGYQDQLIARVMQFDGRNVSVLTPSFFPFISADNTNNVAANGVLGFVTANPTVAMTTEAICFGAKATINSTNNPAGGPDSGLETDVYTVTSHPVPVAAPRPEITLTQSGNDLLLSWPVDAGLFTVQSRNSLLFGNWANVTTQNVPPPVPMPVGSSPVFFRLVR